MSANGDRFMRANARQFRGLKRSDEGTWRGDFMFAQLADTQLGFIDLESGGVTWGTELRLIDQCVKFLNVARPEYVIVCGDLINAVPPSLGIDPPSLYHDQVAAFKAAVNMLDPSIPLVCVCGNHDVGNSPTLESIASYHSNFGDDYFSFWTRGVFNIVVNTSLYHDPSSAPAYHDEQQAWLDAQLAEASSAVHTFVFGHHPWFVRDIDEDDVYLYMPKAHRMPFLEKVKTAGVRALFAGHHHRNSIVKWGDIELITTAAVGRPLATILRASAWCACGTTRSSTPTLLPMRCRRSRRRPRRSLLWDFEHAPTYTR
eukprot:TRINITY_DN11554_c0_g1_i1.p1 TRINITY_DN11554_c0_g1~~TRINITY_DN11554_c0_g1_i1.p1  ORF type:complete len:334 (-),score=74.89 TRINITY_DN11554_c0_g1_i1:372-1316(-)